MDKSDQKKAAEGADALVSFFQQFGTPDIYTQILLETLFEELLSESKESNGQ